MKPRRTRAARSPFAPAATPTSRQEEALAAVGELTRVHGRGPTTLELAAFLGVSRQATLLLLQRLERAGRLRPPSGWTLLP